MRKKELEIVEILEEGSGNLGELADKLGKSKSWTSELLSDLRDRNIVEKKENRFQLANSYSSNLMAQISDKYSLSKVLTGKKEEILKQLIEKAKSMEQLEEEGFSPSTLYQAIKDLREVGVIEKSSGKFKIYDELVQDFVKAEAMKKRKENGYSTNGQRIIKGKEGKQENGQPTAFSAFKRYGVKYYPNQEYIYQGTDELEINQVLIHAIKFADNKKQTAIAGIFYLKHKDKLENSKLWKLANKWNCVEKLADLLAFIDQRDVQNKDLFLSRDEFYSLAQDYDLYLDKKHSEESLFQGFKEIGNLIESEVQVFLLGGANLILRGMKDTTKDIDLVVKDKQDFSKITHALQRLNYTRKKELDQTYQKMNPGAVFEKQGYPRWDIFVKEVANKLHLTSEMQNNGEDYKTFGNLELSLLSLTDILLFKSITNREGDLEDAGLIIRESEVDWDSLFSEVTRQEQLTGNHFSIDLVHTFDILQARYQIKVPVENKLVSRSLERAILLALEEAKTSRELRDLLDFPSYKIYNKLRKLEKTGQIEVDRSGKLNKYFKSN